jgi:general nucleoside transport system ATP-binding protein
MSQAVTLSGITKRYPGVVANDDVNISVAPGSIHAIVGENGAGKSTLMKILYGMVQPDSGTITVDGRDIHMKSPAEAIAAGIGMVHQHFMLAENLSVLENVILGVEPANRMGVVHHEEAAARIDELAVRYGLSVDHSSLIERLGVGARQRVEIIKVLYRGARILILDEPTAVLVPQEVDDLFRNLRELTQQGITVLFISHKLDEVLAIANEITVMRRGTTVATVKPSETTTRQLAQLMVGGELPTPRKAVLRPNQPVVLHVDQLRVTRDGRAVIHDMSFDVRQGEIVGVAGVEGNGQTELVDALIGLMRVESGVITLAGRDVTHARTRDRREHGLAYIPQDRQREGLLMEAPLWENRILGHQTVAPSSKGMWINKPGAKADSERIVREFDVRTPNIDVLASALSGGNQQKFIVGREMSGSPRLLIAAQPTRGVDVGAQAVIWDQLQEARERGLGVLLVSADLDELMALSDRLIVILRGGLVGTMDPQAVTREEIGAAMTGARGAGA